MTAILTTGRTKKEPKKATPKKAKYVIQSTVLPSTCAHIIY